MKKNINLIALFIPIIFMSLMLQYLTDLNHDDCSCAINKDKKLLEELIKYYLLSLLGTLVLSFSKNVLLIFIKNILNLVIFLLFIYISVVFFRYNNELKEIACECSQNTKKTAFQYYLIFLYFSLILHILITIYFSSIIETSMNCEKVSKKVSKKKL
jgi:hypothetical protein